MSIQGRWDETKDKFLGSWEEIGYQRLAAVFLTRVLPGSVACHAPSSVLSLREASSGNH